MGMVLTADQVPVLLGFNRVGLIHRMRVTELAQELGVLNEFKRYLAPWVNKYESKLAPLDINF